MGHFKGRRPRYWGEWAAFSMTSKRAVIVYQHNRCRRAAITRDRHRDGDWDGWPYETLWYYLKGVRYWVSIYWHKVDVTTGEAFPESPLVYHPVEEIPSHVMRVVRKVQAVLGEKITQADLNRLVEQEAFNARMRASWSRFGTE